MSVLETFVLPAQPTSGHVRYASLGGDGRIAPIACYQGTATLTGDASGGLAQIRVDFDRQYSTLVSYARGFSRAQAAAHDVAFETFSFKSSNDVTATQHLEVGQTAFVAAATVLDNNSRTVYPPPTIWPASDEGSLRVTFPNVNTIVFGLQFEIFVFHANVLQLGPIGRFLESREASVGFNAGN